MHFISVSHGTVATSQRNHWIEMASEFHVHTAVEFLNHRGNLEVLEDCLFMDEEKPDLPQINELRGRAPLGSQVSWLSIQNSFSDSAAGSLMK